MIREMIAAAGDAPRECTGCPRPILPGQEFDLATTRFGDMAHHADCAAAALAAADPRLATHTASGSVRGDLGDAVADELEARMHGQVRQAMAVRDLDAVLTETAATIAARPLPAVRRPHPATRDLGDMVADLICGPDEGLDR